MRLTEIIDSHELWDNYKSSIAIAAENYRNKRGIYRGIPAKKTQLHQINYVDPSDRTSPRTSANTHNYYTLWVDNSRLWRDFPKRSQSLVCTTSKEHAKWYGTQFVVVPIKPTTVFGICPDKDFWYSFDETMPARFPGDTLGDLMDWLHMIFMQQNISSPVTYSQLVAALESIDTAQIPDNLQRFRELMQRLGAVQLMDHILDPGKNGFKIQKYNEFVFPKNREVWTSDACLMIYDQLFVDIAYNQHPDFKL